MSYRVSDVLRQIDPEGMRWVPQEALARGTRMHLAMQQFFIDGAETSLLFEERCRVSAMIEWCMENNVISSHVERRFDHPLGFHGHPDFDGTWKKNVGVTLDWKFADAITEGNKIQAEAYRRLTGNPCHLVQCDSAGTIRLHRLKPDPRLWAKFLKGLYELRQKEQVKVVTITQEEINESLEALK